MTHVRTPRREDAGGWKEREWLRRFGLAGAVGFCAGRFAFSEGRGASGGAAVRVARGAGTGSGLEAVASAAQAPSVGTGAAWAFPGATLLGSTLPRGSATSGSRTVAFALCVLKDCF